MAGKTISYTPRPQNSFFTIEELNEFFDQLADVINNKIDNGEPEDVINSLFGAVLIGPLQVVVGDGTTYLDEGFGINYQPIINMADGTEPTDGVTLGQVKKALAGLI